MNNYLHEAVMTDLDDTKVKMIERAVNNLE
jgi:hypothetical protein